MTLTTLVVQQVGVDVIDVVRDSADVVIVLEHVVRGGEELHVQLV